MRYKLSCINPLSKRLEVSLTLEKTLSDPLELFVSKWRPGRYEFGSFPNHFYCLRATKGDGSVLEVTKKSTHEWVINDPYIGTLTIDYQVFANRLDAGGTYVANDFWLINPVNALISVTGRRQSSCLVALDLPRGYKTSTALKKVGDAWQADSYDELVDCPILTSNKLQQINFSVGSKPFSLDIYGEHSLDMEKVVADITKYTLAQSAVMPWEHERRYIYQLLFLPIKIYHGVEHMDSTLIVLGPPDDEGFYEQLMGVCSHELFHYWNIKRIRPKALTPYRYDRENYFDTGYVAEGFTTYYGDLFLVRGGVFDETWYLGELTLLLKRHFENHGRHEASLADSSWDLWVDGYRNDAPHRKVSIYVKGALVGWMLDMTIRKSTDSKKSLDDLMRLLWARFGPGSSGYCDSDIQVLAEGLCGKSLTGFFSQFIHGLTPIEAALDELLAWVGLRLVYEYPEDQLMSYLGVKTQPAAEGCKVISTLPGSLGEEHLSTGDEILKINGVSAVAPFDGIQQGATSFVIARLGQVISTEVMLTSKAYYASPKVSIQQTVPSAAHHRRARWLTTPKGD